MFDQGPDRGPPTALRGWLSDVYFPALLDVSMREKAIDALAGRLGARATIDDPAQGRSSGMPGIKEHLERTAKWLADRSASYERLAFTQGVDRDVTEGTLSLTFEDRTVDVPVAVVAERRKSREVELRIYFAASKEGAKRARLVPAASEVLVPPPIPELLDALAKGDVAAIAAQFEEDGCVRDARGLQHAKKDGALTRYFDALVAGGAFGGGIEIERGGAADDARTCALEFTLVKARGRDVEPQAGLFLFERGDSALIRVLRVYGELES